MKIKIASFIPAGSITQQKNTRRQLGLRTILKLKFLFTPRVTSRDFGMGWGQGSDGGDWRVNLDKILRGYKKARNVNKRGVKWLFYPFFGQKMAKFVRLTLISKECE